MMECYHCNSQLDANDICPSCGYDVKVYKKIIKVSNFYYNEGLEKAGVRNLSGAIDSLKRSLELYKANTNARNLLGLVYFEMGETVLALSEWVISKNLQRRNNAATRYLGEVKNNPARLDGINQTIKKYNQALLYCRSDSKDLATIQLKKVISLNPKLIKAYQLLALLYIQEKKYEPAKKALKTATSIDQNNTTTQRYLKEVNRCLDKQEPKKKKKDDILLYQSGNDTVIMPAIFKETSPLHTIVNMVIGLVIGIAIAVFLILPQFRQNANSTANTALKAANESISTKDQTIKSLEEQLDTLNAQVSEIKGDADGTESKMDSYEQLITAYVAYTNNDITAAGAAMALVKEEDLSDSAKNLYSQVNASVNVEYMKTMYQEGYSAYSKSDFTTAIDRFLKIIEIDETYENGNAIYYLAQSYRRNDDLESAVPYYQKMVDQYKGTERALTSQQYLDQYKKDNPYGTATDSAQ